MLKSSSEVVNVEAPPSSVHTVSNAAEYLLYLFLPREDCKALAGDLDEEYWTTIRPKFGARRAVFWYWCQVCRSIMRVIFGAAGRLLWWFIQKFTS